MELADNNWWLSHSVKEETQSNSWSIAFMNLCMNYEVFLNWGNEILDQILILFSFINSFYPLFSVVLDCPYLQCLLKMHVGEYLPRASCSWKVLSPRIVVSSKCQRLFKKLSLWKFCNTILQKLSRYDLFYSSHVLCTCNHIQSFF